MVDASGLQYLRARYLDTNSGNFLQKDSYQGEQDDIISQNQYIYVLNNPYKYIDSTGNKAIKWSTIINTLTKLGHKAKTIKPQKKMTPKAPPLDQVKNAGFDWVKNAISGLVSLPGMLVKGAKTVVSDPINNNIKALKIINPSIFTIPYKFNVGKKVLGKVVNYYKRLNKTKGIYYAVTTGGLDGASIFFGLKGLDKMGKAGAFSKTLKNKKVIQVTGKAKKGSKFKEALRWALSLRNKFPTFAKLAAGFQQLIKIKNISKCIRVVTRSGLAKIKKIPSKLLKTMKLKIQKIIDKRIKDGKKLSKHKKIKKTNSRRSLPYKGTKNSSADLVENGRVKQRRYYDKNGNAKEDIDYFHQDDGTHKFPHRHKWINGKRKGGK